MVSWIWARMARDVCWIHRANQAVLFAANPASDELSARCIMSFAWADLPGPRRASGDVLYEQGGHTGQNFSVQAKIISRSCVDGISDATAAFVLAIRLSAINGFSGSVDEELSMEMRLESRSKLTRGALFREGCSRDELF